MPSIKFQKMDQNEGVPYLSMPFTDDSFAQLLEKYCPYSVHLCNELWVNNVAKQYAFCKVMQQHGFWVQKVSKQFDSPA